MGSLVPESTVQNGLVQLFLLPVGGIESSSVSPRLR